MSYFEPVTVRFTKGREELISLLQELAHVEETRERFQSDPQGVLEQFGIEITPPEAIPRIAIVPSTEDLERAIEVLSGVEALWPWIFFFPWVGLVSEPEEGGGPYSA